ncbi:MAG: DUF1015 domain-containing protein [Chloroflexi bacterium]|nr:DUF1015 domain-containing protein [Chloroflexota bacterium]
MAEVRPFGGLRYNGSKVSELASVLCPPYDVMSAIDQEDYYQRSPYNVVRVEHALFESGKPFNKYAFSASTLKQWRKDGVLKLEEQPVFYLHEQGFSYGGREWRRRGIIARVRLEGKESGVVRPHEGTLAAAKNDRLLLLRACQANTSPIFALYEDDGGRLSSLLDAHVERPPSASASIGSAESHKLWTVTEPDALARIQSRFRQLSLYIADGHHRYETALAFRDEARRSRASFTGEEAFNFVMMTLVSMSDPGLLILPVHRLARGLSRETLAKLEGRLGGLFEIEEYAVGAAGSPTLNSILETMRSRGQSGICLGVYGLKPKTFMVLGRRTSVPVELMPVHASPAYRGLEVAVLKHLVMEGVLDIDESQLTYTPDAAEALGRVASGEYQLAFFLNPLGVDKLRAVADAGERLPGKSTYFYPKLPTGLVINPLE